MEHHLSHSSVDRLAAFFEFLGQCPELRSILRKGFCFQIDEETPGGIRVNSRCPFMVPSEGTLLNEPVPLCRVEAGEEMLVARVECSGDTRIDLIDMGFIQGSRVRVVRPPRDGYPMILQLDGWEIKLPRDLAECILVTVCEGNREESS
jgi:Fe2+ transport system protein FeoA